MGEFAYDYTVRIRLILVRTARYPVTVRIVFERYLDSVSINVLRLDSKHLIFLIVFDDRLMIVCRAGVSRNVLPRHISGIYVLILGDNVVAGIRSVLIVTAYRFACSKIGLEYRRYRQRRSVHTYSERQRLRRRSRPLSVSEKRIGYLNVNIVSSYMLSAYLDLMLLFVVSEAESVLFVNALRISRAVPPLHSAGRDIDRIENIFKRYVLPVEVVDERLHSRSRSTASFIRKERRVVDYLIYLESVVLIRRTVGKRTESVSAYSYYITSDVGRAELHEFLLFVPRSSVVIELERRPYGMAHPLRSARIKKFRTVIQEVEVLFSEVIYRGLFVACAVTFDSRYRYLRSLRIDISVLIVPVISKVVALPTNVITIHDMESYVITRYRSGSRYLDGQYSRLFVERRRHISRIVERIRHPTVISYVLVLEYVFVARVLFGIDAYNGGH